MSGALRPNEYAHYVGAPSSGVPDLERSLSFASSLSVSVSGHAPVSMFAGAWEKYFPMVTEGEEECREARWQALAVVVVCVSRRFVLHCCRCRMCAGFAEISAASVEPGEEAAVQTLYVDNTGVSRQMVRSHVVCTRGRRGGTIWVPHAT